MPKAVISNRIYLSKPPEGFDAIKKALTYKIVKKASGKGGKFSSIEILRTYKVLPGDNLSIPRGREDLIPKGYEIIDRRISCDMPWPEPKIALRAEQLEIYDDANDSCFINALPGWGKTFVALHIARKLGQKTLIITHTAMLRDQWEKEIKALFNMPVGVIGSGRYDIDASVVVANIQTVTKYAIELSKEFGTVIVDEAHHAPATTFTNIIDASYAKYRIGLSGTLNRPDGKQVLLKDYFGLKIYQPEQSNTVDPVIKLIKSSFGLKPGEPWARKINGLLYDEEYQEYIAAIARAQISIGHKVLVIADRVEFLNNVKELIGETCVLVTGENGTNIDERNELISQISSGEKEAIAGSRQIFSEGISVDILSCVILATPIAGESLLEQIIGRIMRLHKDKPTPVVIDIQLRNPADRVQNNARLGFYLKKGWKIESL